MENKETLLAYLIRDANWPSILRSLRIPTVREVLGPRIRGEHYRLCVFHQDKTPSLRFDPSGFFNCFGCGKKGDMVDFIQELYFKSEFIDSQDFNLYIKSLSYSPNNPNQLRLPGFE